ncbi:MAG: CoA transferase [Chloroflexi bacterium]|nr:CoA transferase [Chloroflexota bacterium]
MTQRKPLEGIRVTDFSWIGVGPITTKYLSDFGAEVIKIEHGARPDGLRTSVPFIGGKPGLERSGHWFPFNTGKLDITLNMNHPKAQEVARRLIAISDVVVENYTTRIMKGWGLEYEDVRRIKPDVIMVSLSMEGRTGPHKDFRGYGTILQSAAGLTHLMGWPDRLPTPPGNAYTDYTVPHTAAVAVLAALGHRQRTGQGQWIDISCLEVGISSLESAILDYVCNGRVQQRAGNKLMGDDLPYAAPHGAYRCQGDDRWCVIAVFTDQEWEAFCRAIGTPQWTEDPRFSTRLGRIKSCEELDRLVETWTVNLTPEEVMHRLQAAGVAAGVVESAKDIREDPQLAHRGQVAWLPHPEEERPIPYDAPPFRFSSISTELVRAPLLGEHNQLVYRDLLQMPQEEYEALVQEGALE